MRQNLSLVLFIFFFFVLLSSYPQSSRSEHQSQSNTEAQEQVYIPKNLDEAFIELKKTLSSKDLKEFKKTPVSEIIKYHFSLGMGLRNSWGLWSDSRLKKYFNKIGIFHPDDMSGVIIKSFWRHLNNKPIQLEEQVEYYQEFWKYNIPAEDAVSPIDGAVIHFISSHVCEDETISEHCRIHFGVSESDGTPWAYQYRKGVFKPPPSEQEGILKHAQQLKIKNAKPKGQLDR